ncbi:hypothetical protein EVAR_89485_1 [Eumeta japonica]|uniref:Uncharacterized protein n=1 Tax=Eumeta variegata TaxID=151549 RepID=A0A4C1XIH2_EUMVA|nr:hypothetical protein EVAR_89485_1 [Eumeta japonica]
MAVFSSSLPKTNLQIENNLYDIVKNVPQASVAHISSCNENSDYTEFQHKTDKFFEPKKKSRLKVRTIRDVRREYEKYVYTYLKDDLEKQKNLLFKKIESGSAGDDDTVDIAKKILQSDQPKLRSTWFMITKVNPLRNRYSVQYAFWNGIKIRLSGSKGGSDKFKWKYDISQNNKCLKRTSKYKQRKQNYLLKSSLFSNFKPGPLSKKCILDKSYQKWTIGEATLVELPRVSLVIKSKYNSALDVSILKYIEDLPDENGKLNENWTNFALSALGTSINGSVAQKTGNSDFNFELKYKNEQKFLMTRRDVNTFRQDYETESTNKQMKLQEANDREISAIVEELVRATEISINQDQFFVKDEEEPSIAFCWELYGNVVKSKDTGKLQSFETNSENENLLAQAQSEQKIFIRRNLNISFGDEKDDNDICLILPNKNDSDIMDDPSEKHFCNNKSKETDVLIPDNSEVKPFSRWFFMTIEDDFDELQFVEKGFFVKYENIIKAIDVARSMKKTVRLSGLKCKGENNNPQFGIYALSDMEKLCVFVGPYDENEKLGMETIKGHRTYTSTRKTRGSWLITKKIDNFKVIENPMSFWPRTTSNINQNDNSYSESNCKGEIKRVEAVEQNLKEISNINSVDKKMIDNEHNKTPMPPAKTSPEKPLKVVKPITIRKTDELFQIKNGPVSLLKKSNSIPPKIIINKNALTSKIYLNKNQIMKPFFKTVPKNSISNRSLLLPKINKERGMLILKPEEINKKHADNKLAYCNEQLPTNCPKNNEAPDRESLLVENKSSKKTHSYSNDVLVISDDDDACVNFEPEKWKDVWIEISSIPNFGYLRGKKNEKNEISFQFPGFRFSEFYNEKEAFQMLNKILCRKVYLPKSLHLDWCVLKSVKELKGKKIVKEEDFSPDLGLRGKWFTDADKAVTPYEGLSPKEAGPHEPLRFGRGRVSLHDQIRESRPSTAMTEENVANVKHSIEENQRITYEEIRGHFGIVTSEI